MKAVNLLPSDLRGTPGKDTGTPAPEAPAGIGAYFVLGALALVVAALAVFVLASNGVKEREAKLQTAKAETENAQQRAAALKPYADFAALVNQRATTVRSLAEARFDWDRALKDLSRALPKEAALSDISGNVKPGAGGTEDPLRGALSAPAITLKGCVDSQVGVARVMSRLRNVAGVTRVTLSSSDKGAAPATGSAPVAPASGGAYCGKGSPPTFNLVVFFERDAARVGSAPGVPGADPSASASAPATGGTESSATDTDPTGSARPGTQTEAPAQAATATEGAAK
jgi:Tfp pilus assembly protein PilN